MNPTPRPEARDLLLVGAGSVALIVAAVVLSGMEDNTLFVRLLYTARVTMLLFTVALALYILPGWTERKGGLWLSFWTAAFVAYAVHVYYSFFVYFQGSVNGFYAAQGPVVATINVIITAWWALDCGLAWFSRSGASWISTQRGWGHAVIFATFFASTVIFHAVDNKQPLVIVLGALMGVVAAVCLAIRLKGWKPQPSGATP